MRTSTEPVRANGHFQQVLPLCYAEASQQVTELDKIVLLFGTQLLEHRDERTELRGLERSAWRRIVEPETYRTRASAVSATASVAPAGVAASVSRPALPPADLARHLE
jgi:hypothetical protein